jgi:hypothetical protein
MVVLQVMMDLDEQTSCPTLRCAIPNSDSPSWHKALRDFGVLAAAHYPNT